MAGKRKGSGRQKGARRRTGTQVAAFFLATLFAAGVGVAVSLAVGQDTGADAPSQVTVRLRAYEVEFDVLGVPFQAWTYGGTVPGKTIRVTQGTHLTIILDNAHSHTHSVHTHLTGYPISIDGSSETFPLPIVPGQEDDVAAFVQDATVHVGIHGPPLGVNPIGPNMPVEDNGNAEPGQQVRYDYIASRTGTFVYHCHVFPISEHVSHGLFGMIIVYPPGWTWEELPPSPESGNTQAFVTAPDGTVYFEDVVMLTELDLTGATDKALLPTTGGVGKVHLANFKAWNEPHFIGPVRSGMPVRVVIGNLGHEVHSWHIHGHVFDVLDKLDPAKRVVMTVDTLLTAPGESFETQFIAGQPGLWFVHDHIEANGYAGMIPWLLVTE